MHENVVRLPKLLQSKRAFAIPVTYMILFASLIVVITLTYSFSVERISARGKVLRYSVAKQNMRALDDAIHSVAWSHGGSEALYMDDCGGIFRTATSSKNLIINLTDEQTFRSTLYNGSVGECFYELEPSESSDYGSYLRGDDRAIINKTSTSMTQLYVAAGNDTQILVLCYRPLASAAYVGVSGDRPLNVLRVSIVNLNSSENLAFEGKFCIRVTSREVTTATSRYVFNSTVSSLALKATLDGTLTTAWVPVSSGTEGAIVDVEVVECSIKLQQMEG